VNSIDVAREEIFARFQQDDGGKFWVERWPWCVSYSGGKDSTLLLLLVCEALEKFGSLRTVWVIFSDTGIEQDGIVERVQRNFDGLERWAAERGLDVRTAILAPSVAGRFFNVIVGLGYGFPAPPQLRWCTKTLKKDVIDCWKRSTFRREFVVTLTGERFAESAGRNKRMNERLQGGAEYWRGSREIVWCPLRDVETPELWDYVCSRFYPWGEGSWILLMQYGALSLAEVLEGNKERRSGCRFCTFGKKNAPSECEAENEFCRRAGEFAEHNVEVRHLIDLAHLDVYYNVPDHLENNAKILSGEYACGRLTIPARKEVLRMVREMESATGRVWIGGEDMAFIERQWAIDEERIRRGELVDARTVLKTEL